MICENNGQGIICNYSYTLEDINFMNWKKKLQSIPLRNRSSQHLYEDLEDLIQLEIIEKMIEDTDKAIYKYWQEDGGVDREAVKQQLREKWLGK